MSEPSSPDRAPAWPEPEVVASRRISLVWVIPLIALAIGIWLAYRAYVEQGPSITIRFETAAGLQARKTKVKYKDVDIGEVTGISVSDDLRHVVVRARLVAGAEQYLREKTRFWVERPRVSAGRVSGLETLLSGPYIAIDPVTRGPATDEFVGLETPPLFTTAESGTQFLLQAEDAGGLNPGAPVYYRSVHVGRVIASDLDAGGEAVTIKIFITAPYDRLVLTTTRFWNVSGIDVQFTADGVQIDTESLLSVIIGGIAFGNPKSLEAAGRPAEENHSFPLYASRDQADETLYLEKERYLMFFQESVYGLAVNAPVMLRGIPIGRVLDIRLKLDVQELRFLIPVLIEVEPARIGLLDEAPHLEDGDVLARLVARGLRGQLKSGSLLTGRLYIDLDLHPDAPEASLDRYGDYFVLPTIPGAPLDALTQKANAFLDDLLALPLEEIGGDLQDIVAEFKKLVQSDALSSSLVELEALLQQMRESAGALNRDTIPELNATLQQTRRTLKGLGETLAPDSPLSLRLQRTLEEFRATARALRVLSDYLERHPEALIRGKVRR